MGEFFQPAQQACDLLPLDTQPEKGKGKKKEREKREDGNKRRGKKRQSPHNEPRMDSEESCVGCRRLSLGPWMFGVSGGGERVTGNFVACG